MHISASHFNVLILYIDTLLNFVFLTHFSWIFRVLYTSVNFLMFKLVLEKAEETEIKLPTSAGSWKKNESSRETSIYALLTMPKPLTVDHSKLENSERDGNTRPPDLPLEKPICRSGSNS